MDKFNYNPPDIFMDATAYPDNPGDEDDFREQLSRPHMQVKAFLNALVDVLASVDVGASGASNIGVEPVVEEGSTNVQGALGDLKRLYEEMQNLLFDVVDSEHVHLNMDKLNQLTQDIVTKIGNDDSTIPTSKAVLEAMSEGGMGDMMRAMYDTNSDGIVNNSDHLGGYLPEEFVLKAESKDFCTSKTTAFNSDGSITEVYSNGTHVHTVFNADGSITETTTPQGGVASIKTITFNEDGSISEVIG